jgi:hypothetical protein
MWARTAIVVCWEQTAQTNKHLDVRASIGKLYAVSASLTPSVALHSVSARPRNDERVGARNQKCL